MFILFGSSLFVGGTQLLRGLGGEIGRGGARRRQGFRRYLRLPRVARAPGGYRGDHPVELPPTHGRPEDRPYPRGRLHHRPVSFLVVAAHDV